MKGIILFSLGLMMLLLALSCNAASKEKRFGPFGGPRGPPFGGPRGPPFGRPPFGRPPFGRPPFGRPPFGRPPFGRPPFGRPPFRPPKPEPGPDRCGGQDIKYDNCGQRCTCDRSTGNLKDCTRVRKEFISLSRDERRDYIKAVKTVSTDPRFKKEYEKLLQLHKTLFVSEIHKKIFFLPWHRWFVLMYENLLRKVDCRITACYWDWSVSNPFDTSDNGVWNDKDYGFGGNGAGDANCVPTGPFGENVWNIIPLTDEAPKPCLQRNFQITPNKKDIQVLLDIPATDSDFTKFECRLRLCLHNTVHYGVGGTMFTNNSAAAPEFFLHHTMVDKIWTDWQKKGDEYKNVYFPEVSRTMNGTKYKPKELLDVSDLPGGVRVDYEESQVTHPCGQKDILTQLLSLPIGLIEGVFACNDKTCKP